MKQLVCPKLTTRSDFYNRSNRYEGDAGQSEFCLGSLLFFSDLRWAFFASLVHDPVPCRWFHLFLHWYARGDTSGRHPAIGDSRARWDA